MDQHLIEQVVHLAKTTHFYTVQLIFDIIREYNN